MDSSKKKNSHKILIVFVISIIVLIMILRNNQFFVSFFENPTSHISERVDSKELERRKADEKMYEDLKALLEEDSKLEILNTLSKVVVDDEKEINLPNVDIASKKLVSDKILPRYKEKIDAKNNQIRTLEFNVIKGETTVNYPLIFLIIFVAGILGGYARRYYADLDSLLETAEEAVEIANKTQEVTKDLKKDVYEESIPDSGVMGLIPAENRDDELLKNLIENTTVLERKSTDLKHLSEKLISHINAIKDNQEGSNDIFANLIFGIISSSLSILGLSMADSDILEFSSGTDYLLLWGWATIFSIFSKTIVEALANNIKNRVQSLGSKANS